MRVQTIRLGEWGACRRFGFPVERLLAGCLAAARKKCTLIIEIAAWVCQTLPFISVMFLTGVDSCILVIR